jgi:hypothetical protein
MKIRLALGLILLSAVIAGAQDSRLQQGSKSKAPEIAAATPLTIQFSASDAAKLAAIEAHRTEMINRINDEANRQKAEIIKGYHIPEGWELYTDDQQNWLGARSPKKDK